MFARETERGSERHVPPHAESDGSGDHLLFGGVHVEVALGVGLGEDLSMGGVADFSVHDHDPRVDT
jgi:hypothetical protein